MPGLDRRPHPQLELDPSPGVLDINVGQLSTAVVSTSLGSDSPPSPSSVALETTNDVRNRHDGLKVCVVVNLNRIKIFFLLTG